MDRQKGEEIEKHWKYGYVWRGNKKGEITENYVNEKTINYIIKYVHKTDEDHQYYKPIILTSAGIGKGYFTREDSQLNQFNNEKTREFYRTRTGHKLNLPIYYRNIIYTEEEREKLWLQKLDKQERWIMGEKIDVSSEEGETIYQKTLQYYQEKNRRLGFGNDEIDWDKKEYEEKRRILKQAERLQLSEDEINRRIKNFENYRRTKEKTRTHENIRARADIFSRMEQ